MVRASGEGLRNLGTASSGTFSIFRNLKCGPISIVVFVAAMFASGCERSIHQPEGSESSSSFSAHASPSMKHAEPEGPRVRDTALGASYVIPSGYEVAEDMAPKGPEDAHVTTNAFAAKGDERASSAIKVEHFYHDSTGGLQLFSSLTDDQAIDYILGLLPSQAGVTVKGTEKFSWNAEGISASAAVAHVQENSKPERTIFYAFLHSGDKRWMITTEDITQTKQNFQDLKGGAAEAFARSLQPL